MLGKTIKIIEPPLVRIEPKSEIFLVSGESVNVSCESVGGTQPISITWSKVRKLYCFYYRKNIVSTLISLFNSSFASVG